MKIAQKVRLIWITPDPESYIVHMTRVSDPAGEAQGNDPARLIRYLIERSHWSPFEMAHACLEIFTTRDISHQLIRHRSFGFQEFSQRHADVSVLGTPCTPRPARMKHPTNWQISLPCEDQQLAHEWIVRQQALISFAMNTYEWAIKKGIAPEVARAILPQLAPTRLYMAGNIRSWIDYLQVRLDDAITQKEHVELARIIAETLQPHIPITLQAALGGKGLLPLPQLLATG